MLGLWRPVTIRRIFLESVPPARDGELASLSVQGPHSGGTFLETAALWKAGQRASGHARCGRQDPRPVGTCRRHRRRRAGARRAEEARQDRSEDAAAGARQSAPRPLRRRHRKIHLHRPQLFRPRRRNRRDGSARADHLHEGDVGDRRPERRRADPARLEEDRLGSRTRRRHRQEGQVRVRGRRAELRRRLLRRRTTSPSAPSRPSARASGPRARAATRSARSARGW